MSELVAPDEGGSAEYWSAMEEMAAIEAAAYLNLFVPILHSLRATRMVTRQRGWGVRRRTATIPAEVVWAGQQGPEVWRAILKEEMYTLTPTSVSVRHHSVRQAMTVRRDEQTRELVRPTLYLTEDRGHIVAAKLGDVGDLIGVEPDLYVAGQRAWFDRLGAIATAYDLYDVAPTATPKQ